MDAIELMQEMIADGVEFHTIGEKVRWRNAQGKMTNGRLAALRKGKADVFLYLTFESYRNDPTIRLICAAVRKGNHPDSRWQSRHGAIADETGIGVSATYRLIDRLLCEGILTLSADGILTVGEQR